MLLKFFWGLSNVQRFIAFVAVLVWFVCLAVWFNAWLFGDIKTQRNIAENQTGAAIASGSDASNSVGENETEANKIERNVEDAQRDVNTAVDADDADRAGRDGLCSLFGVCDEG